MQHKNLSELNKTEKSSDDKPKRLLLCFIIVILIGGMYLIYKKSHNNLAAKATPVQVKNKNTSPKTEQIKPVKENIPPKTVKQQTPVINYLKPTNKDELVKKALLSMGKSDPFIDTTGRNRSENNSNMSFGNNKLPMPPSLDSFPLTNLPDVKGLEKKQPEPDPVELKGFIGNKAIISVNGLSEALGVKESFQGVTIIAIDTTNLTAKLSKDGKVFVKHIKMPENNNLKVVQKSEL